jgi:formylglycine-generating enzyme required for sulfatase activity
MTAGKARWQRSDFSTKIINLKKMRKMKKVVISFFTLLLAAAATMVQAKPKLAVFVVGVDDWKRGDVLAHIAGEELNRDKKYEVVTRSGAVQVKLKQLRRAAPGCVDSYDLRTWGVQHGVEYIFLITTPDDKNFSANLLDRSSCQTLCSESSVSGGLSAVALKELAWSLTTELHSDCSATCGGYYDPELGLEMVCVKGGTFMMGFINGRDNAVYASESAGSSDRLDAFYPAVNVEVGDFLIGEHEVTQGEWLAVMDAFPTNKITGSYRDDKKPMVYVSWNDIQDYLAKLNEKMVNTGKVYRLPTEAEWEYAARGGVKMYESCNVGCVYSGSNVLNSVAVNPNNWNYNYPSEVKTKFPNELGIYDMSGNVWELCAEGWRNNYTDTPDNSSAISRGGSWNDSRASCRVSKRAKESSRNNRVNDVGFRIVLVLP